MIVNSVFWSEVFFTNLVSFATGWSLLDCPLSSATLLELAASSNWLRAAKAKDKEFIKNSKDLSVLAPSYILDKVFGIDFIVEVEFANGPYYYSVDVTSNTTIANLEQKVYKSKSDARLAIAEKMGLDGHIVVGIDERFEHFSLLSHWEKIGMIAAIEKALSNEMPYVRITKE
jgi:hypothetical protein